MTRLYTWSCVADMDCWYQPEDINVLDFCPIHIYLNFESLAIQPGLLPRLAGS